MNIRGYSWMGVRADNFDAATRFYEETLGLPLVERDDAKDFAMFCLPSGQLVEIFGPKDTFHDFLTGPVVGFEVEDVRAARQELVDKGVTFLTDVMEWGKGTSSTYFRGPDGSIFELWCPGTLETNS